MKAIINALLTILCVVFIPGCNTQQKEKFNPVVVYRSRDLIITHISRNTFAHTSFLKTRDFAKLPCNGLIVRDNRETIIFDTPTDNAGSEELIRWIKGTLHCRINAIIPTHFHSDGMGGLKAFHKHGIPSYAYIKTIAFARANHLVVPQYSFSDSLVLQAGDQKVIARFFGEGHTKDGIIGYFPEENIMFGGCLVKELDAAKGYLGDANMGAWSCTVEKVKKAYPGVKVVVPGQGTYGNKKLLDYTISLFRIRQKRLPSFLMLYPSLFELST